MLLCKKIFEKIVFGGECIRRKKIVFGGRKIVFGGRKIVFGAGYIIFPLRTKSLLEQQVWEQSGFENTELSLGICVPMGTMGRPSGSYWGSLWTHIPEKQGRRSIFFDFEIVFQKECIRLKMKKIVFGGKRLYSAEERLYSAAEYNLFVHFGRIRSF